MITSVEDGADLFCFAQDQLARLVQAGALTKLGTKAAAEVTELNDSGAVAAATIGSDIWCYPMTSDNGYFMIYDSSVIPAEHVDSLEDIIADCEAAGRGFSMELETSACTMSPSSSLPAATPTGPCPPTARASRALTTTSTPTTALSPEGHEEAAELHRLQVLQLCR